MAKALVIHMLLYARLLLYLEFEMFVLSWARIAYVFRIWKRSLGYARFCANHAFRIHSYDQVNMIMHASHADFITLSSQLPEHSAQ